MSKVGLDCKLYRNTASYGSPTWAEVEHAKDVTLDMTANEADASSRASIEAKTVVTHLARSISFELLEDWGETDLEAFLAAYEGRTVLDIAVVNGAIATSGTRGRRADFYVTQCARNEPMGEHVSFSITLKPAPSHDPVAILVS